MDIPQFIKNKLVPILVEEGKLSIDKEISDSATIKSVEITPLGTDGTFMLSICNKVAVKLSDKATDEEKCFLLITKITPDLPPEFYESSNFNSLFYNEEMAYTDIIPSLGLCDVLPKFYYCDRKPLKAVMVLGDFSVDGWQMSKSIVNLSLEHIILAVKELGRFHGYSYGLKETDPEQFHKIISKLREARYVHDNPGNDMYNISLKIGPKRTTKVIRESELKDEIPESFLQRLEKELEEPMAYSRRRMQPQEPLATLCHGDYLRNNIAFKYADNNKDNNPIAAMMFDFQTLRYSSPMVDFAIFIANSTGVDVRSKHFDDIFRAYHQELVKALCEKWCKNEDELPEHYSYDSFLKEYVRYLPYGICIASSFLPILHVPIGDSPFNIYDENVTTDFVIQEGYEKGGETVDRELRGLLLELYNLQKQTGVEFE